MKIRDQKQFNKIMDNIMMTASLIFIGIASALIIIGFLTPNG